MVAQADKIQRMQEIANRGIQDRLPQDKKAIFDEVARRGLITLPGGQGTTQVAPQVAPQVSPQETSLPDFSQRTRNQQRAASRQQARGNVEGEQLFEGIQSGQVRSADLTSEQKDLAREAQLRQIPEFTSGGLGADIGLDTAALAAITTDPNEFGQILSQADPRIGIVNTPEGGVIAVNNETGVARQLNRKGVSPVDILQGLGIASSFAPGAGGAARLAALARKPLAANIAGQSAAAGLTETAQQAAQEQAGGTFDKDVITQSTIAGAAGPVGERVARRIGQSLLKRGKSPGEDLIQLIDSNPQPARIETNVEIPDSVDALDQLNTASIDIENKLKQGVELVRDNPELASLVRKAKNQGIDEGTALSISGMSRREKNDLAEMLRLAKRGDATEVLKFNSRPEKVIGDNLLERFKYVKNENLEAGSRLDNVALETLQGQTVDLSNAKQQFLNKISKLGVELDDEGRLVFDELSVGDIGPARAFLENTWTRLNKADGNALKAHRLKTIIDESISFGKTTEGLSGRTENIIKSLRKDIDNTLDSKFQAYNEVNTKYSDTKKALEAFMELGGRKFDPVADNANEFAGRLAKNIASDNKSREQMINAINVLETTARKYGKTFEDNIAMQESFRQTLVKIFGSPATTGLEGITGRVAQRAASGDAGGAILDVGSAAIKGLKGQNKQKAIQALEDLLK